MGYGSRGEKGQVVNESQAQQMLAKEVNNIVPRIKDTIKTPLTQNQLDALTSFSYNVGTGWLKNSSVVNKLNAGDYQGAAKALMSYNKAGGKVHQGLVNRRQAEAQLFLADDPILNDSGDYYGL